VYVIIIGAGDIGTPLTDVATQSSNEVVVIERNAERAEAAADAFDCLVLHDDATVKDTSENAGIGQADAIVSTTDQDATNIMICLPRSSTSPTSSRSFTTPSTSTCSSGSGSTRWKTPSD
jgi:trk system potassium uptake protein TrkA